MNGLRNNSADLVASSVSGRVAPARIHSEAMAVDHDGRSRLLPGTGGIALGVHAGDAVASRLADHLMAGASIEDDRGTPAMAGPLHLLSCIGNRVRNAAGKTIGVVAGKRGGLAPGFWAPQLVGAEIPDVVAAALLPEERVVVETLGRGLALADHPDIALRNLSPRALAALPLVESGERLQCTVRLVVPPELAGAGLGQDSWIGDLEITDHAMAADLAFGDLVAFSDIDSATTRFYRPDWLSVGIVSHGPGHAPGHGVGVTMLLSGPAHRFAAIAGPASLAPHLIAWSEGREGPNR